MAEVSVLQTERSSNKAGGVFSSPEMHISVPLLIKDADPAHQHLHGSRALLLQHCSSSRLIEIKNTAKKTQTKGLKQPFRD